MNIRNGVFLVAVVLSASLARAEPAISDSTCQSLDREVQAFGVFPGHPPQVQVTCDDVRALDRVLVTKTAPGKILTSPAFDGFDLKVASARSVTLCPKEVSDASACHSFWSDELMGWASTSVCFGGYAGSNPGGSLTPGQIPRVKHQDLSRYLIPSFSTKSPLMAVPALRSSYEKYVKECPMALQDFQVNGGGKHAKVTEGSVTNACARDLSAFWSEAQSTLQSQCKEYLSRKITNGLEKMNHVEAPKTVRVTDQVKDRPGPNRSPALESIDSMDVDTAPLGK